MQPMGIKEEGGVCDLSVATPPSPSAEPVESAGEIQTKIADACTPDENSDCQSSFDCEKTIEENFKEMRLNQSGGSDNSHVVATVTGDSSLENNNTSKPTSLPEPSLSEVIENEKLSEIKPNITAIYKSDSGFSEHDDAQSIDDYDSKPSKVKTITVEEAHTLFKKRLANRISPESELSPLGGRETALPIAEEAPDSESDTESDDYSGIDSEDGVRHRDERRREVNHTQLPGQQQQQQQQRPFTSRRSSTDSSEDGHNLNVRDLKNELRELEEKFRQAMVANAGLDNEKTSLTYQVELLKDRLEEAEEQTALVTKELREKNRDFELLKRQHFDAQRAVQLLQMQLDEQTRLLTERGMVLVGNEESDDEVAASDDDESQNRQDQRTRAIVSSETASILAGLGKGPLDVRIKRLADERDDLQDQVRRLKLDLEEERNRSQKLERSTPFSLEDADWETKRLIDDYKFKLQKYEQDINTLQTNVARLESQVVRFKTASETAERAEEELKTERRKLQRELREATARMEELETANKHLETRLGKLKTAKSNLLKDL